jgi:hypothetical protein
MTRKPFLSDRQFYEMVIQKFIEEILAHEKYTPATNGVVEPPLSEYPSGSRWQEWKWTGKQFIQYVMAKE